MPIVLLASDTGNSGVKKINDGVLSETRNTGYTASHLRLKLCKKVEEKCRTN